MASLFGPKPQKKVVIVRSAEAQRKHDLADKRRREGKDRKRGKKAVHIAVVDGNSSIPKSILRNKPPQSDRSHHSTKGESSEAIEKIFFQERNRSTFVSDTSYNVDRDGNILYANLPRNGNSTLGRGNRTDIDHIRNEESHYASIQHGVKQVYPQPRQRSSSESSSHYKHPRHYVGHANVHHPENMNGGGIRVPQDVPSPVGSMVSLDASTVSLQSPSVQGLTIEEQRMIQHHRHLKRQDETVQRSNYPPVLNDSSSKYSVWSDGTLHSKSNTPPRSPGIQKHPVPHQTEHLVMNPRGLPAENHPTQDTLRREMTANPHQARREYHSHEGQYPQHGYHPQHEHHPQRMPHLQHSRPQPHIYQRERPLQFVQSSHDDDKRAASNVSHHPPQVPDRTNKRTGAFVPDLSSGNQRSQRHREKPIVVSETRETHGRPQRHQNNVKQFQHHLQQQEKPHAHHDFKHGTLPREKQHFGSQPREIPIQQRPQNKSQTTNVNEDDNTRNGGQDKVRNMNVSRKPKNIEESRQITPTAAPRVRGSNDHQQPEDEIKPPIPAKRHSLGLKLSEASKNERGLKQDKDEVRSSEGRESNRGNAPSSNRKAPLSTTLKETCFYWEPSEELKLEQSLKIARQESAQATAISKEPKPVGRRMQKLHNNGNIQLQGAENIFPHSKSRHEVKETVETSELAVQDVCKDTGQKRSEINPSEVDTLQISTANNQQLQEHGLPRSHKREKHNQEECEPLFRQHHREQEEESPHGNAHAPHHAFFTSLGRIGVRVLPEPSPISHSEHHSIFGNSDEELDEDAENSMLKIMHLDREPRVRNGRRNEDVQSPDIVIHLDEAEVPGGPAVTKMQFVTSKETEFSAEPDPKLEDSDPEELRDYYLPAMRVKLQKEDQTSTGTRTPPLTESTSEDEMVPLPMVTTSVTGSFFPPTLTSADYTKSEGDLLKKTSRNSSRLPSPELDDYLPPMSLAPAHTKSESNLARKYSNKSAIAPLHGCKRSSHPAYSTSVQQPFSKVDDHVLSVALPQPETKLESNLTQNSSSQSQSYPPVESKRSSSSQLQSVPCLRSSTSETSIQPTVRVQAKSESDLAVQVSDNDFPTMMTNIAVQTLPLNDFSSQVDLEQIMKETTAISHSNSTSSRPSVTRGGIVISHVAVGDDSTPMKNSEIQTEELWTGSEIYHCDPPQHDAVMETVSVQTIEESEYSGITTKYVDMDMERPRVHFDGEPADLDDPYNSTYVLISHDNDCQPYAFQQDFSRETFPEEQEVRETSTQEISSQHISLLENPSQSISPKEMSPQDNFSYENSQHQEAVVEFSSQVTSPRETNLMSESATYSDEETEPVDNEYIIPPHVMLMQAMPQPPDTGYYNDELPVYPTLETIPEESEAGYSREHSLVTGTLSYTTDGDDYQRGLTEDHEDESDEYNDSNTDNVKTVRTWNNDERESAKDKVMATIASIRHDRGVAVRDFFPENSSSVEDIREVNPTESHIGHQGGFSPSVLVVETFHPDKSVHDSQYNYSSSFQHGMHNDIPKSTLIPSIMGDSWPGRDGFNSEVEIRKETLIDDGTSSYDPYVERLENWTFTQERTSASEISDVQSSVSIANETNAVEIIDLENEPRKIGRFGRDSETTVSLSDDVRKSDSDDTIVNDKQEVDNYEIPHHFEREYLLELPSTINQVNHSRQSDINERQSQNSQPPNLESAPYVNDPYEQEACRWDFNKSRHNDDIINLNEQTEEQNTSEMEKDNRASPDNEPTVRRTSSGAFIIGLWGRQSETTPVNYPKEETSPGPSTVQRESVSEWERKYEANPITYEVEQNPERGSGLGWERHVEENPVIINHEEIITPMPVSDIEPNPGFEVGDKSVALPILHQHGMKIIPDQAAVQLEPSFESETSPIVNHLGERETNPEPENRVEPESGFESEYRAETESVSESIADEQIHGRNDERETLVDNSALKSFDERRKFFQSFYDQSKQSSSFTATRENQKYTFDNEPKLHSKKQEYQVKSPVHNEGRGSFQPLESKTIPAAREYRLTPEVKNVTLYQSLEDRPVIDTSLSIKKTSEPHTQGKARAHELIIPNEEGPFSSQVIESVRSSEGENCYEEDHACQSEDDEEISNESEDDSDDDDEGAYHKVSPLKREQSIVKKAKIVQSDDEMLDAHDDSPEVHGPPELPPPPPVTIDNINFMNSYQQFIRCRSNNEDSTSTSAFNNVPAANHSRETGNSFHIKTSPQYTPFDEALPSPPPPEDYLTNELPLPSPPEIYEQEELLFPPPPEMTFEEITSVPRNSESTEAPGEFAHARLPSNNTQKLIINGLCSGEGYPIAHAEIQQTVEDNARTGGETRPNEPVSVAGGGRRWSAGDSAEVFIDDSLDDWKTVKANVVVDAKEADGISIKETIHPERNENQFSKQVEEKSQAAEVFSEVKYKQESVYPAEEHIVRRDVWSASIPAPRLSVSARENVDVIADILAGRSGDILNKRSPSRGESSDQIKGRKSMNRDDTNSPDRRHSTHGHDSDTDSITTELTVPFDIATCNGNRSLTPGPRLLDGDDDNARVHLDWRKSSGGVIAQQLARMRETLKRMELPTWYRKSTHFRQIMSGDIRSLPAYRNYKPRQIMSGPPTPTGQRNFSAPLTVSTRMSFTREARLRTGFSPAPSVSPLAQVNSAWSFSEIPIDSDPTPGFTPITAAFSQPLHRDLSYSIGDEIHKDVRSSEFALPTNLGTNIGSLAVDDFDAGEQCRDRNTSMGDEDDLEYTVKRDDRIGGSAFFYVSALSTSQHSGEETESRSEGSRRSSPIAPSPVSNQNDTVHYDYTGYHGDDESTLPRNSNMNNNNNNCPPRAEWHARDHTDQRCNTHVIPEGEHDINRSQNETSQSPSSVIRSRNPGITASLGHPHITITDSSPVRGRVASSGALSPRLDPLSSSLRGLDNVCYSGGVQPPSVTMEEIVDSLLGLSTSSRSPSNSFNGEYHAYMDASTMSMSTTPDQSLSESDSSLETVISHDEVVLRERQQSGGVMASGGRRALKSIIINDGQDEEKRSIRRYEGTHSDISEEVIRVKCSYRRCGKVLELQEARKTYKTCHNCYTYYCSRDCRRKHWDRHKKKCLFGRVNSLCKHVIYHSRYNEVLQQTLSHIARDGYLSRGRGAVNLSFPNVEEAYRYITTGVGNMTSPPHFTSVRELEDMGEGGHNSLRQTCINYDPEVKFVLNVCIVASQEIPIRPLPRKPNIILRKCAKVRLFEARGPGREGSGSSDRETLILTAPPGVPSEGGLDKKARQVCFVHIQSQLRHRGISIRHQFPVVYEKLCRWVDNHQHMSPVTIYPRDGNSGKTFMCLIIPDTDQDTIEWVQNPEILETIDSSIDLDAEMEKVERAASSVALLEMTV